LLTATRRKTRTHTHEGGRHCVGRTRNVCLGSDHTILGLGLQHATYMHTAPSATHLGRSQPSFSTSISRYLYFLYLGRLLCLRCGHLPAFAVLGRPAPPCDMYIWLLLHFHLPLLSLRRRLPTCAPVRALPHPYGRFPAPGSAVWCDASHSTAALRAYPPSRAGGSGRLTCLASRDAARGLLPSACLNQASTTDATLRCDENVLADGTNRQAFSPPDMVKPIF